MGKFIRHIISFLFPVLLLLFLYPVNRRQRYVSLKDDCFNHGIWLHDRLFLNSRPVDIAFLGSSHTVNAINDGQLEELLQDQKAHVLNLGYCRLGRNLDYVILKELLKTKQPKILVVEIRESENRYSHPIFPYIAEEKDVLLPAIFFNRDLLKDLFTALAYKTELIQDHLFSTTPSPTFDSKPYGFAGHSDTAKKELLLTFSAKRKQGVKAESKLEHTFYNAFPENYLEKISSLCKEHQVMLCFLYLPAYSTSPNPAPGTENYKAYGKLLLPPSTVFEDANNWFDENHLNNNGAHALSLWLGNQLRNL